MVTTPFVPVLPVPMVSKEAYDSLVDGYTRLLTENAKLKRELGEGLHIASKINEAMGLSIEDDPSFWVAINHLDNWKRGCGWAHTPPDIMQQYVEENQKLRERIKELEKLCEPINDPRNSQEPEKPFKGILPTS